MTDFYIIECEQGTPEWHAARRGIITASMFETACEWSGGLDERQAQFVKLVQEGRSRAEAAALAGYQKQPSAQAVVQALEGKKPGDFSTPAKSYARRLALERIGAEIPEQFETYAMRRGRELEPEARELHDLALSAEVATLGSVIQRAGFVTTPDRLFGASADGLINEHPDGPGGAEYKCYIDPEKLWDILMADDWSALKYQVQGGLWITGRKWWDMCLYCPSLKSSGLHFTRKRVWRDEAFIEQMQSDLLRFSGLVEQYTAMAKSKAKPAA